MADSKARIKAAGGGWVTLPQVATTSGTTVSITTAIPDWATEIELMLNDVGTNTNNQNPALRIGPSSGVVSTGYLSNIGSIAANAAGEHADTAQWDLFRPSAYQTSESITGLFNITRWDADEHLWIIKGIANDDGSDVAFLTGHITLSDHLTDMQLCTDGGTATFNGGEVRVRYR